MSENPEPTTTNQASQEEQEPIRPEKSEKQKSGRRVGYHHARLMKGMEKSIVRRFRAEALNGRDDTPIALEMERFLQWRETRNYSQRTLNSLRVNLRSFLLWAEPRDLRESARVTRPIIESYQRHLWRYRKDNDQPLGIGTQRNRLNALKDFFSWLCRQNLLPANPASDLELPRSVHRLPQQALSSDELSRIFNVPDISDPLGLRDRALLELLYATGLRRGEAAKLRVDEIDFNRGVLFVNQGKGKKDRYVPIGGRAIEWLNRYLDQARPRLVLGESQKALFISSYGEAMSTNSLGNRVKKIMLEAGVKRPGGCHLFRHSCATHMHDGGADIRFVQKMLGHQKLETTAVYTHVSIEQLREIHERSHPHGKD